MLVEQLDSLPTGSLEFEKIQLENVHQITDLQINKLSKLLKPLGSLQIYGFCTDDLCKSILNATKLVFLCKLAGFKDATVEKSEHLKDEELEEFGEICKDFDRSKVRVRKFILVATKGQQQRISFQSVEPVAGKAEKNDCELTDGKKKACKNCSCGRAQQSSDFVPFKLMVNEANEIDTSQYKSNCGSCSLGDEFRCAGCPFVGLPAFKPGEIIRLDATKVDK